MSAVYTAIRAMLELDGAELHEFDHLMEELRLDLSRLDRLPGNHPDRARITHEIIEAFKQRHGI